MQSKEKPVLNSSKDRTGIAGFDEITGGGLPRSRTTLVIGGPGSGKTILGLQFLMHGAQHCDEPGIFVAFEESSKRIVANAETFGWNLPELQPKKLYFMDAQPAADMAQSGNFDLCGMLAALEVQTQDMGARRIVFDAMDVVLALIPDPAIKRREVYRIHEWLLAHELSAIITAKADAEAGDAFGQQPFGFMQFMVDCAVILSHRVVQGVSQRNLRVQKYRGTAFDENESPFLIGANGFEVDAMRSPARIKVTVSSERVSTGVKRFDTMMNGGYYRGSSVLITGFPGTAKTTLAGAFAESACERGEHTLFVSFDSDVNEVIRDLSSVGIQLARFKENGSLHLASARTITGSAETYLARIKKLATDHAARCMVIDPMSTWSKSGNDRDAHSVAERLTDWCKANEITLLCTSLLDEMSTQVETGMRMQISTLADTWIHLNYLMQAGERNRGISIIKSRGMAHSNQVRELILSDNGITLADIYTAGGEVLMGTLRWEKESAERVATELSEVANTLKKVRLDAEEAELVVKLKSMQVELEAKQVEKALLARTTEIHKDELSNDRSKLEALRGADTLSTEKPGEHS